MIGIVLIVVAVAVILFLLVAAMQPAKFAVARSAAIAAPVTSVFTQVNDLRNWNAWSPWAKLDPACKNSFSGAAFGQGAGFAWDGNNKVGAGRMTIIESQSPELIRINLEFLRPFKSVNTTEFTFASQGGQTLVTWTMTGKNNFMSKVFGLIVDCDRMVGKDFEKGLASLKAIAEARK